MSTNLQIELEASVFCPCHFMTVATLFIEIICNWYSEIATFQPVTNSIVQTLQYLCTGVLVAIHFMRKYELSLF